jgi:hypothetical protein
MLRIVFLLLNSNVYDWALHYDLKDVSYGTNEITIYDGVPNVLKGRKAQI